MNGRNGVTEKKDAGRSGGEILLSMEHIGKSFPGIRALDDVSFELREGEILALVGENGAGKSTLINIVTGVIRHDQGRMRVRGGEVAFSNVRQAFDAGIGVVHQERNLIPTFSIAENICIDELSARNLKPVDRRAMLDRARAAMDLAGLDLPADSGVETLSSAQMQIVEIARALAMDSKILVLDEPTASISQNEVERLLSTVKRLRALGHAIIYVSHKLEEVFAIADRIMVLRDGREVGKDLAPKDISRDDLIVRMVGRKEDKEPFAKRRLEGRPVVLEARAVSSAMSPRANSFSLRRGEILGWYGLVGSGRTELAREIIGIDPVVSGSVVLEGAEVSVRSIADAISKCGIYYISENRKEEGLFLIHSVAANIGIVALKELLGRFGLISYGKERALAENYRRELSIKTPSVGQTVSSLSGGNQQKICIAKGLVVDPDIVIFDEPTVGIDVKTKGEIHRLIYSLAESGKSIIVITSDLSEMVRIADRVLVFREGTICGEMENDKEYDSMSARIMDLIIGRIEPRRVAPELQI
jgi:ribose transport system ATP-binding protein